MILRLALRSLAARPARSAVLALGFGLGVGVMAVLLGVGGVILDQARAPALVGGGDVVIGSPAGRVPNASFVLSALRRGGPFADQVRTAAPSERATVYLRRNGRSVPVAAVGSVPSASRALGDPETAAETGWTDDARDLVWAAADPDRVLRTIDRFHAIPDVPARAGSWAEWLYFNGRRGDARFYLTLMAGPADPAGTRTLGVRLQLERGGTLAAYSASARVDGDSIVASAPDLTAGSNSVRLAGRDYRIALDLAAESGRGRAAGTLIVHAPRDRSMPPTVLRGAGGWVSGYVVPVVSGTLDGRLLVDGAPVDFSGGSAYHDHNWGFWQGVSWEWGQVAAEGESIVYGRVHPPADAADPARPPAFLVVIGPDGPAAFSTEVTVDKAVDPASGRPTHIDVRSTATSLPLRLSIDVGQTTITPMREGGIGGGLDFLQMRGRYHVTGRVAGRSIDFTAPGSAETWGMGKK